MAYQSVGARTMALELLARNGYHVGFINYCMAVA
jgi:hypothetical protein